MAESLEWLRFDLRADLRRLRHRREALIGCSPEEKVAGFLALRFSEPAQRILNVLSGPRRILGEPFRVGVDAGQATWTYGYYRYRLFGPTHTKDLVLYFNKNGTVSSFTFNTSFPEGKQHWEDPVRP